jgi:flagellar basal-body rod modification protein FlgD
MSTIDTSNSIFNDLSIASKQPEKEENQELGQSAFLELMITQLENQSPLDPQDNTQFIAQLAQFSTVESLDSLNNNFDTFTNNFVANQALQASTLVGRSVSVVTDEATLESGGIVTVSSDIPASSGDVSVNIYNESGSLVDSIALGTQPSGEMILRVDGMNAELNGELLDWQSSMENGLESGRYRFEVVSMEDGEPITLETALSANVNSVTVAADGTLSLNLAGVGSVSLNEIKQFN